LTLFIKPPPFPPRSLFFPSRNVGFENRKSSRTSIFLPSFFFFPSPPLTGRREGGKKGQRLELVPFFLVFFFFLKGPFLGGASGWDAAGKGEKFARCPQRFLSPLGKVGVWGRETAAKSCSGPLFFLSGSFFFREKKCRLREKKKKKKKNGLPPPNGPFRCTPSRGKGGQEKNWGEPQAPCGGPPPFLFSPFSLPFWPRKKSSGCPGYLGPPFHHKDLLVEGFNKIKDGRRWVGFRFSLFLVVFFSFPSHGGTPAKQGGPVNCWAIEPLFFGGCYL